MKNSMKYLLLVILSAAAILLFTSLGQAIASNIAAPQVTARLDPYANEISIYETEIAQNKNNPTALAMSQKRYEAISSIATRNAIARSNPKSST